MIHTYFDRMKPREQPQVLAMAEQALRRGLELAKDHEERAQGSFDLALVLSFQGRPKEAVPLFELCIAAANNQATKEERSLRLAEALRRAGRISEAEALFKKLEKSQSATIREKARTGLMYVANDKARSSAPKGK
jgi:tetratricopeptide (TPR) repeat protein